MTGRRAGAEQDDAWGAAYAAGLGAAGLIHDHYPELYAARVARRPLTLALTTALVRLWLGLVNRDVIPIAYAHDIDIVHGDPAADFLAACAAATEQERATDEEIALETLPFAFERPAIPFLGLALDEEDWGGVSWDDGALLATLWWLVRHTGACPVVTEDPAAPAVVARLAAEPVWAALAPLAVPAQVELVPLCRALNRLDQPPVPRLGDILAYACRLTGNLFADVSQVEADDQEPPAIPWRQWEVLQELAADWREADAIVAAFIEAVRRVGVEPGLLIAIARTIADTAARLRPDGSISPWRQAQLPLGPAPAGRPAAGAALPDAEGGTPNDDAGAAASAGPGGDRPRGPAAQPAGA
ncbi:MAG: hypothetical protein IT340_12525 [Chloroflexi bacterium]|nr:hypothetical protein [Chloroflexota bacterium]